MGKRYIKIAPTDNVAVAIDTLSKGENIEIEGVTTTLLADIDAGHKFALKDFIAGEQITKYGYSIGVARGEILQGEKVDEKRVKTALSNDVEYSYTPTSCLTEQVAESRCFEGYRRADGRVGIRNEVVVLPTVGCVNGCVTKIVERFKAAVSDIKVDSVWAYTHNYGCSQLGEDHENTRKVLRDIVLHPNIGGVLVVGLGCENNQIEAFETFIKESGVELDPRRVKFMTSQKVEDEVKEGLRLLSEIYDIVSQDQRTPCPISTLNIGLKCGGSDGFSGITANPLLGRLSDYIIARGGSTILTEVPEMFGAEQLLMNRCQTQELFKSCVDLIVEFKEYFISHNQPIYENPSPGNKAGGISTLEEKSLGCVQKSGNTPVRDVLEYGERLRTNGLTLLTAPGNDLVASTALASAGCQMVLFTTGRGTPFGTFVPTMKISTNTKLSKMKSNWIDFNAGALLEDKTMEELLESFVDLIIEVASGRQCRNEINGYSEIAIFKQGVTL